MDQVMLQRNLRQGERYVALGRRHVAEQRRIITNLKRAGRDAHIAGDLLKAFQQMLNMHEAICTQIREELADRGKVVLRADAAHYARRLH